MKWELRDEKVGENVVSENECIKLRSVSRVDGQTD